jgi:putative oxidoreductase
MEPGKQCWGDDLGKLVLRLSIGGLLLFHGVGKIMHGIEQIVGGVQANGAPSFLAYGVYLGEVLGPILVLIGLFTRFGALMILVDMIVAILMVHRDQLGTLDPMSGGWKVEAPAIYLLGALAIMLMGAGRISIDGARRRIAAGSQATPNTRDD